MSDPVVSTAPPAYPPYDPEIGDYTTYKPLAKTKWAQDGSGEEGLTFADFLDVINPLQHLPIISHIYRAITGDRIGLAAKLIGDTLYGGPVGFLASGITAVFEGGAGKSTGEMIAEVAQEIFDSFSSDGDDAKPATQEARTQGLEQAQDADVVAPPQVAAAPATPIAEPSAAAPTAAARPVAPIAATTAKPDSIIVSGRDEASQRIAKSIAEARRAQQAMLLTSLQQNEPTPRAARREHAEREEPAKVNDVAKPLPNPYLPPERPASSANWSNETLAEAIARYERAVAANRR